MGPHQRMMLQSQLRHLEFLQEEVEQLDQEVEGRLVAETEAIDRLDQIPGMGRRMAQEMLAEIGADMSRFPTEAHLASWARLCPGNNESAGKRWSGATGRGNPWLRSALVEVAWGAVHTRDSYLGAKYRRLASRRGGKRAILAVAHSILKVIYHLLQDRSSYRELGAAYFEQRDRQGIVRRAVRRIEGLGYKVSLEVA
jgi:transposase